MVAVLLACLGLIFGSFVNALVWRLHEQFDLADKGKKRKAIDNKQKTINKKQFTAKDLSIVRGRSMCPHCGHILAAKDLVPVVSWLSLRGRCRYCGKHIPDSPVVELLVAVLFAGSYLAWPLGFHGVGLLQFICWLVLLVGFAALAVYDWRWFLLPDRLVFPLTGLAVAEICTVAIWSQSFAALWEPLGGAVVIFGLFWMLFQISGGSWIGGGDVKLGVLLGLMAGTPLRALVLIFFASLAGTIVSLPQLLKGRKGLTRRVPFGPPLLLAAVVVVLYGERITTWYQGLIIR